MMISLYYIKHHLSRNFLSRQRKLINAYCLKFYFQNPDTDPKNQGIKAFFEFYWLFIFSALYTHLICFYSFSTRYSPHYIHFIPFHFLKEIKSIFPLLEKNRFFSHFISFQTNLPFHHDVHCIMPSGIATLLPLCTAPLLPK